MDSSNTTSQGGAGGGGGSNSSDFVSDALPQTQTRTRARERVPSRLSPRAIRPANPLQQVRKLYKCVPSWAGFRPLEFVH